MIKYALVQNVLAPDSNGCTAVVSASTTKDLNAVIDFMIAEGTGLTRPQAMAYFEKLTQSIEFFLEEGHRISTPLFRIRPTIRGVFSDPNDIFDPSRQELYFSTSSGPRLSSLASRTKLEKVKADVFKPVPVIRTYLDGMNKTINTSAVSDGSGVIRGQWLRFDPDDSRQGVFFVSADDSSVEIPMTGYTEIIPTKVHFRVPTIPAGDYRIVIKTLSRDETEILQGQLKFKIRVD